MRQAVDHEHQHHHGAVTASPRELHFRVDGMTCAGCSAAVQRAIEAQPGVESAAISVTEARATVVGDELDPNAIVQSIRKSGYDADLIEDLPAPAELRSEIELRQSRNEREWRRRAVIGLSIWAPLEALHWMGRWMGWHAHGGTAIGWMDWIMLIGATAVLIAAGGGFYRSAWNAALRRTTNMDTLIAMGATTAYVFSLVVLIARLMGKLGDQPLYFAESAALLGIISLGHYLEARAAARAGSAVRELLELQPEEAELVTASQSPGIAIPGRSAATGTIPSAQVQPGDRILIRPGGRVPVDGVVIEGESEIDESVVTGESLPVRKTLGAQVVAGSMNTTGRLIIEASVDGRHTTVARIANMVQRAQTSKANIQRLADRVAVIFVPAVLIIALITLVGWWIWGSFATGVISTVTVLIISCPCALGLATPMAVMVGAGAASQRGILIKSAMALEIAGRATHVVFDKTGTLTRGAAEVTGIEVKLPLAPGSAGGRRWSSEVLLRLAASVEGPSEHPVAKAIVRAANARHLQIPPVTDFQAIPGEGVRGNVEGKLIIVTRDEHATARILIDGEVAGTIMVADELRADAKAAIERLRAMGLRVTMLSGDRMAVAENVGSQLGLKTEEIQADATPQSKLEFIARLKEGERAKPQASPGEPNGEPVRTTHPLPPSLKVRGERYAPSLKGSGKGVAMVGDGINDAAALAQADLGIAMASGTNIAIESADVVIPSDRVTAVPQTIEIARQTLRTIRQNLFFAFIYNAAAIPLAALGLLGVHGPLMAAAAMGLSDVTVIGNAIRLKRRLEGKGIKAPRH